MRLQPLPRSGAEEAPPDCAAGSATAMAVISVETETVAVTGVDVSAFPGGGAGGITPPGPLNAAA